MQCKSFAVGNLHCFQVFQQKHLPTEAMQLQKGDLPVNETTNASAANNLHYVRTVNMNFMCVLMHIYTYNICS